MTRAVTAFRGPLQDKRSDTRCAAATAAGRFELFSSCKGALQTVYHPGSYGVFKQARRRQCIHCKAKVTKQPQRVRVPVKHAAQMSAVTRL